MDEAHEAKVKLMRLRHPAVTSDTLPRLGDTLESLTESGRVRPSVKNKIVICVYMPPA